MNTPKFLLAAAAATLLSTAAFAAPPSSDQVTVSPAMTKDHHGGSGSGGSRLKALFSPNQLMMFRMEVHQATQGMDRDHKKAYRKAEMQKIRGMSGEERSHWLQGLQVKWNALPQNEKAKMERRMAKRETKREQHHGARMGQGQYQGGDQYQSDDQDGQPQMDQSR